MSGNYYSKLFFYHYTSRTQDMRGLLNYGLSCCVNALLQSFSATWELTELLDKWQSAGVADEGRNVPLQLRRALRSMRSEPELPAPHQDFLHCLDRNNIRLYRQQDADELFLSILNLIHQQISDKDLATEIRQLYRITVEQHLQCLVCAHVDLGTSYLLNLPLALSDGQNTLEECISSFFQLQELRGDDECYCKTCAINTPAKQGFKLISLPPVLCVHLKRFRSSHGYTKKLNVPVVFQETLNFADILKNSQVSERYIKKDSQYCLYAVIVHCGGAMFGHYTAYIRCPGEQSWYRADDSQVGQVSWEDVQQTYGGLRSAGTAYMLLYRKSTEANRTEP